MKTLMTMFAVLVLCGTISAEDDVDREVAIQLEQSLGVIGDKVGEAMDAVEERFGEPASVAFGHLVSYYYYKGYMSAAIGAVTFLLLFVFLALAMRSARLGSDAPTCHKEVPHYWMLFFCIVFMVASCATCFTSIFYAIEYLSGPERHAILDAKSLLGL